MTYLNLVNGVLRRLREDEVTTVQESAYSKLIGDLVNDAKEMIESAWDWTALRTNSATPLTISTTSGDFTYSLVGSGDKGKLLSLINDTSNLQMSYQPAAWFDNKFLVQTPASGAPEYFTYNGVDANGDIQIDVYPKPDGVYVLKSRIVIRKTALSGDTDVLAIPSQPVLHLSLALAARERGETGGSSAGEFFAIADKYLSDAIALDAEKHPEDVTWYTP